MPSYEFVCSGCSGLTFVSKTQFPETCPLGHPMTVVRRQWSFAFHRRWPGGYSPTVGRAVSNDREFSDALKAASDQASEELGMEHRFVPMDPRDRDATRVTENDPAPVVRNGGWEEPKT